MVTPFSILHLLLPTTADIAAYGTANVDSAAGGTLIDLKFCIG
jgi:hypothetical protein